MRITDLCLNSIFPALTVETGPPLLTTGEYKDNVQIVLRPLLDMQKQQKQKKIKISLSR
jgi:hypothetical protein